MMRFPPQTPLLQAKQSQFSRSLLRKSCFLVLSPALLLFSMYTWALWCPSCSEGPETEQYLRCSLKKYLGSSLASAEYRGIITSPVLLAILFLKKARMPLAFLTPLTHYWLIICRLSASTPWSFSDRQLPSCSSLSLHHCTGLLWCKCRTSI